MAEAPEQVAVLEGAERGPVLFVCEHASNRIPDRWGDLGLEDAARQAHIAWDPGALGLARALAKQLSAPLLHARVSRLVYDLNRAPGAADAIPATSEVWAIPGNRDLDAAARAEREALIYRPWQDAFGAAMASTGARAMVTVHSFTPEYHGRPRTTRIGIPHDHRRDLADALLAEAAGRGLGWHRNQPYGPEDGVLHTATVAAEAGLLAVMIEVRNDLLTSPGDQAAIAAEIAAPLTAALKASGIDMGQGARP